MAEFHLGQICLVRESGARVVVIGFERDHVMFLVSDLKLASLPKEAALEIYEPTESGEHQQDWFEQLLLERVYRAMAIVENDDGEEAQAHMERCEYLLDLYRSQRGSPFYFARVT